MVVNLRVFRVSELVLLPRFDIDGDNSRRHSDSDMLELSGNQEMPSATVIC